MAVRDRYATGAPTAFALSRQNLPILEPAAIPEDAIERGAYVLRDADGGEPEVILIGTGSRSRCASRRRICSRPTARRVVSMPCMDTFAAQADGYREQVLPPSCPGAGRGGGGEHVRLGPLDRRPAARRRDADVRRVRAGEQVYKHFGITAERVARRWPAALAGASEWRIER